MPRERLDIFVTPQGKHYAELLWSIAPFAASFALTVLGRGGDQDAPSATAILQALEPHLLRVTMVSEWPGTRLANGQFARKFQYRLSPESMSFLVGAVPNLWGWNGPRRPQDLHFLDPNENLVLGSIASEREAWIELNETDLVRWWSAASPELVGLFRTDIDWPGEVLPLKPFGTMVPNVEEYRRVLESLRGGLEANLRSAVSRYLRTASCVISMVKSSSDILNPRLVYERGNDFLSDGYYFWRRDAAEYIDNYRIGLDREAITHMQANGWRPPKLSETEVDEIEHFLWSKYRGWD